MIRRTRAAVFVRGLVALGVVALVAAPVAFLLSGLLHWAAAYRAVDPLLYVALGSFGGATLVWFVSRRVR